MRTIPFARWWFAPSLTPRPKTFPRATHARAVGPRAMLKE